MSQLRWLGVPTHRSTLGGLAEAWNTDMNALVMAMFTYQRLSPQDRQIALGGTYPGINWMAQVIAQAIAGNLNLANTHQNMVGVFRGNVFWNKFTLQEIQALAQGLALVMSSANSERGNVTDVGTQTIDNTFRWNMAALIRQQQAISQALHVVPSFHTPTVHSVPSVRTPTVHSVPGVRTPTVHSVPSVRVAPCPAGQTHNDAGACVSVGFTFPRPFYLYSFNRR